MARPVPKHEITNPFKKKGDHWKLGFHTGVDYACSVGTNVVAADDGRVLEAGKVSWGDSYGTAVVIKHSHIHQAVYAHLSEVLVKKGDRVTLGQLIGKSGNTGNSTGPHLHFEVRKSPYKYTAESMVDPDVLISVKRKDSAL
jgi:murein DD-endopeptidase MepM/ murein hydrolase activator NlpD